MYLTWKNHREGKEKGDGEHVSNGHQPEKLSGCPMVRLQNMEKEDKLFSDKLFRKSVESTDCSDGHCNGSVMFPKYLTNNGELRPKTEVLSHASDFIEEFYDNLNLKNSAEHLERLSEVRSSIQATGGYHLTFDELQFGAKTAWRNAPRCVGRRFWQRLEVFDCRQCKTAKEMFAQLCKQIEYGTNGGNIRSTICVFPQRTDGTKDFRVWNSQLISYAGHKMPDESIVGDPANVAFTKVCEKLGFKFAKTQFDILPLVLQANGEDPEVFTIPPHLVTEVDIRHPKYDVFEKLKLKWYALPAVSGMLFDCGGIQFPAAPFNGWYMSTEIAARNFCDQNRLNILDKIAEGMGFDTSEAPALWKDRVMAEMNFAVLDSFKRNGATLIDHYTATENFMEHFQKEYLERGGCPADWVWLVPPMSGSLCPVFHQEMISYKLRPSYDYQAPAWKVHTWKKANPLQSKFAHKYSFKTVAKIAKASIVFWKDMVRNRQKCTIIFATETGKAAKFASILAKVFDKRFNVQTVAAKDYFPVSRLASEQLVLLVASTFGNGEPPSNAEKFFQELMALKASLKKKSSTTELSEISTESFQSVRFGVFALGSKFYPHFCAFGHTLDNLMADIGANRCVPCGEGDEMRGQEDAFHKWCHIAFKVFTGEFYPDVTIDHEIISDLIVQEKSWKPDNNRLVPAEKLPSPSILDLVSNISNTRVNGAAFKSRKQLQASNSDRRTFLVSIDRSGATSELDFAPGDHLAVFAPNPAALVEIVLDWLPQQERENADRVMEFQRREDDGWVRSERLQPCSVRQALTYVLDLCAPPQQSFLMNLSNLATDPKEQAKLKTLANNMESYEAWKEQHAPSIAFLAKEFPSTKPPVSLLLETLNQIVARYYSISSSPKEFASEIQLTVGLLEYSSNDGVSHQGMCSSFLNTVDIGTMIPCFVRKAPAFRLPEEPRQPVVMVGPGTGIAPFRGFWQDRHHDRKMGLLSQVGATSLYFGCRSKDLDHIYEREIQDMCDEKTIDHFYLALSRQPGVPKTYVQHIMWDNRANLFEDLVVKKGHLYVCGDVRMADDVVKVLIKIFEKVGQCSHESAEKTLKSLKLENRFHTDIFGATSAAEKGKSEIKAEA